MCLLFLKCFIKPNSKHLLLLKFISCMIPEALFYAAVPRFMNDTDLIRIVFCK